MTPRLFAVALVPVVGLAAVVAADYLLPWPASLYVAGVVVLVVTFLAGVLVGRALR